MNCPRCDKPVKQTAAWHGQPLSVFAFCECGWESPMLDGVVVADGAHRLAKLKAAGAKPGWYGPDGEKASWYWEEGEDDSCAMVWHGLTIGGAKNEVLATARLCGFVEVTNVD
jgi:hypothetical protein